MAVSRSRGLNPICPSNSQRKSFDSEGATAGCHTIIMAVRRPRLDYCNAVLAGLPAYQLDRFQSAINAAARMITELLGMIMFRRC